MHVVFIPSWYPRDSDDISGSFFREQAQMLAAHGCQTGVIAPRLGSLRAPLDSLREMGVRFEMDGAVATLRGLVVNLSPRLQWPQARLVAGLTRRLYRDYVARHGRPDILHVHSALLAGVGAMRLLETENIPFVFSEHSSAYARGRVGRLGLDLTRRISARATSRFAVSTQFAGLMSKILGPESGAWKVMPNAVDAAFLNEPLLPVDLNQSGFRFLHISLLDANKNVASILNAFSKQFRGQNDITIRIGGDGPTKTALAAQATALGISQQVEFVGRLSRSQVRAELSLCNAFVLSSRFETFGVVLVEALAMGKPVIATACGGPEDIVTPETGSLVPVDDDVALGEAMARMIREYARFTPEKLRSYCRDNFGPNALSSRWIQLYEGILSARAGGQAAP